jgi:hypothetical protein
MRPFRASMVGLACGLVVLVGCGGDAADENAANLPSTLATTAPTPTTTPVTSTTSTTTTTVAPVTELALDHVQVIGSHNSYHLLPDQALFDALGALAPELAEGVEYSHRPLTEQLEMFGIRQLEIDVYADPEGSLFSTRAADALVGLAGSADPALAQPGFKVLHIPDIDYATTCLTLIGCLEEIDAWSTAHPTHLPLMIMLELKSESVPDAAASEGIDLTVQLPWTDPLEVTAELLDALDAEIRSVLDADRLIEPDDVRDDAATLETAILENGWPSLADSRGKVLFAMTDGGAIRDLYVDGAPNLEGRPIFTNGTPGQPDAAFIRFDEPGDPGLNEAVASGYLVRTRTDSPTGDARTNDTTRRDLAIESGAQFLSTDYYDISELFDSPYKVELPGGVVARCNPISAPATCTDDQLTE